MIAEPLSVALQSGTLYNTPPPTQGLASLIILALFERLRVAEAESFDHVHGLVEATKRAFRVRDRFVTDPDRHRAIRSTRYPRRRIPRYRGAKIDRRKAATWPAPSGEGDTVWMGAADASGLVVSYIQSIYWEFGSGCVLPRTGVLMQNRGASFSLDQSAVNPLQPGRLPFHTLNPALAVLRDGRVMAYGTMGGDGQPQTQAALFTRHVLFRQPLPEAIDAPRWLLGRTWGSTAHQPADGSALRRQPDRPAVVGRSRRRGFAATPIPTPWAMPAPWCCIRTARWKARTTRAPMAARRVFSVPLRVVAPARLPAARGREQDARALWSSVTALRDSGATIAALRGSRITPQRSIRHVP